MARWQEQAPRSSVGSATHRKPSEPSEPSRALLHPAWWAALLLLVVNDHLLKGAGWLPGFVTGKVSDLAGLVVAPVLLAVLVRARSRRALAGCHLAVGGVFATINATPQLARCWEACTALAGMPWRVWSDPSDLAALPMLLVSWTVLVPVMAVPVGGLRSAWHRTVRAGGVLAAALACAATSALPPPKPAAQAGRVVTQAWGGAAVFVLHSRTGLPAARWPLDALLDSPVLDAGTLFYAAERSVVAAEATTGRVVWQREVGEIRRHRLQVDRRHAYAIVAQGEQSRLEALDRATGHTSWQAPLAANLEEGGRVAEQMVVHGDLVLVVQGASLVAHDAGDGRVRWTHRGLAELRWPAAAEGRVFVGEQNGMLWALDARSGRVAWRFATSSAEQFARRPFESSPLAAGRGRVLLPRNEWLVALDAQTRLERWTAQVDAWMVVEGSVVAIDLSSDELVLLDLETGRPRWSQPTPSGMVHMPVVSDGVLFVRSFASELHGFDMATGEPLWTFDLAKGCTVPREE